MESVAQTLKKMEIISEQIKSMDIDLLSELDEFPLSTSIINKQGFIEAANNAFCDTYGYSKDEIIGQHFTLLVPVKHKEYYNQLHEKFMETPFEFSGLYQMANKKKQTHDILIICSLIDIKGENKRFSLTLKVSKKTQQEDDQALPKLNDFLILLNKKLKHSQKKLQSQEMAASIVRHDMKNKLNNIISLSQMLQKHAFPEQEKKLMLSMIEETAEGALQEIDRIKKLEKMERGEYQLNEQTLDLLELIKKVHHRFDMQFKSKNLKILLHTDNPKYYDQVNLPYYIKGDKIFMDMLFTNLIQNAIEASPENETILIEIKTSQSIEISIHNWGTVPENIKDQFFSKYVTEGKRNGTGLGTYICKMITEAHHGMIAMASDKLTGTYLTVVFPIRKIDKVG